MTEFISTETGVFHGPLPQEIQRADQQSQAVQVDLSAPTFPIEGDAAGQPPAEAEPFSRAPNNDELEKKSRKADIPPHLLEAAGRAVDTAVEISERKVVSSGKMLRIAFGERELTKNEHRGFLDAINQDPRVRYKGKGKYLIKD
jgi:hypothetical protein